MRTHGENDESTRNERTGRRRLLIPALAIVAVLGIGGGALALTGGDDGSAREEVAGSGSSAAPGTPGSIEPAAPRDVATAGAAEPPAPGDAAPGNAAPNGTAPSTGPGNAAGPDASTSTSSPVLPSGGPNTYYPAQQNTQFSRYTVHPDGRTLTTRFWGGECATYRVVVDTESATRVAIRVQATDKGGMCTTIAVEVSADVILPTPLGDRAVVDAKTGATITPGGHPLS
ncbi:hypothetical protein [Embleya sp. NBC_00896]|uniref:hypothetical protein n=1 Tax=Embleya sp. NBC_00896 TaxID=2975961 RepID=UPI003866DC4E|nr:hypothetical protein OG928_23995 [Embleya sp. NBC_00896]